MMRHWIKWLSVKISRDTTSGQFIPEIDGLRFIAVTSVVLFHLNWFITSKTGREESGTALSCFFSLGSIGVQLFFVISGFVIALPFAQAHLFNRNKPSLRNYLFRRLTRLEPPYIINLAIRFLLLTLVMGETSADLWPHLLASMCYLHNMIYGVTSAVNPVAWSLEIELQFYLLAPLVAYLFQIKRKGARRSLLVGLICLFSLAAYTVTGSPRFGLSVLSAAQFFLTGFLLLDVYLIEWQQRPPLSLGWDLLAGLGWSGVIWSVLQGGVAESFIVIPVFTAYVGAFRGRLSNWFFRQPIVYSIGGMCYTIYLYHYSVMSALIRPLLGLPFWRRTPLWVELIGASAVLLPVVLLVCTLMFLLIEKPCMKKDWHLRMLNWSQNEFRHLANVLRAG